MRGAVNWHGAGRPALGMALITRKQTGNQVSKSARQTGKQARGTGGSVRPPGKPQMLLSQQGTLNRAHNPPSDSSHAWIGMPIYRLYTNGVVHANRHGAPCQARLHTWLKTSALAVASARRIARSCRGKGGTGAA